MTDIKFAKEHMGEYFHYRGYKVRVIGYDTTGIGERVIISKFLRKFRSSVFIF